MADRLLVKTLLATMTRDDSAIEVQVRAQDLAADKDHGGVILTNDKGQSIEVPLEYKDRIENPYGPGDDLWVKKILVKELPAGMSPLELRCTGFVDCESQGGGLQRFAEDGEGVAVKKPAVDALFEISRDYTGPEENQAWCTARCDTAAGQIELGVYSLGLGTGLNGKDRNECLKEIRFTDSTNYFDGAKTVQVVVIPRYDYLDLDQGRFSSMRDIRDLDHMNTVTLTRQEDGTYFAKAPPMKAFAVGATTWCNSDFLDEERVNGYEVALVDPATDKWDSKSGANYFAPLDTAHLLTEK